VHHVDRGRREGQARVEGGEGRVVPAGDLAEVDGGEDRAGQVQPGPGREGQGVGDAFAAQRDGYLVTGPPLAAACSVAVIGTSEAPKSTCFALNAAMPALLPTAE
jgi:hypothetical protein